MEIDWDLVIKVGVPFATLILGKYLERWLTRRPNLISYLGHASAFTIRGGANPGTIHTHAVVVANTGREAANNVRLGHFVLPEHYQLTPAVEHTVHREPNGSGEIVLPKLVPGEQVTISYLYFPPLLWSQIHSYAKSDEGLARILQVLPTPQWPKPIRYTALVLLWIGVVAVAYVAANAILWALR